ncbi:hypothetical protein L195_g047677, partial [Trifolium pratense]
MKTLVIIFATAVSGMMSPYPTVDKVTAPKYKASTIVTVELVVFFKLPFT